MLEFQINFRINGVPFYSFWMQIQNRGSKLLEKAICFSAILCYSAIFCCFSSVLKTVSLLHTIANAMLLLKNTVLSSCRKI